MEKIEWIKDHIDSMVEMYEENQAKNLARGDSMNFMKEINHAQLETMRLVKNSIKHIIEAK
jgi:hypothetical protein